MKKKEKQKKKRLPLKKTINNSLFALRQIYSVSKLYFFVTIIINVLNGVIDFFAGTYLLKYIVNGVKSNTDIKEIIIVACIILGSSVLFGMFSTYYYSFIAPKTNDRIGQHIQKLIFAKAKKVDLECYENPEYYDNLSKAINGAWDHISGTFTTVQYSLYNILKLALTSFLIFTIDPLLIVFALVPIVIGLVWRKMRKLGHDFSVEVKPVERRQEYTRRTFYLAEYSKDIRMGNMAPLMIRDYLNTFEEYKAIYKKYGLKQTFLNFIGNFGLDGICILSAMVYAIYKTVILKTMDISDCIVILNSLGSVTYSINNFVNNITKFNEHALYIEDVREFLQSEEKIKSGDENIKACGGDIVFENVSFTYLGSEKETLKNISLNIKQGEKVALVGLNGSGKTTLVKLLLRLYDPSSGKISLNRKDIKEYNLESYRDNYSCVFQDFKVFSLSVKENVLGREIREGDDEKVIYALKESGAYDKISTLDGGINTILTKEFDDKGTVLSIGETQKVSLAKAFVSDSKCIILDEPSSALDPIAENLLFENMMKAAQGRTLVFISHRLSSCVSADKIFLMQNGEITETGTHKELMIKNGEYAKMFNYQANNYQSSDDE